MTNEITSYKESSELHPDLYKRLFDTLRRCPQFDNNQDLQSIFVTNLSPWRDRLPQTNNRDSRVRQTINLLYEQRNARGENALVLLLRVFSECIDPGDALCHELSALADKVEESFLSSSTNASEYLAVESTSTNELESYTCIPQTILIPAGEFWMGGADGDPNAQPNEKPQHKLSLPSYEIGKYPVTNAQYRQFVREAGHHPPIHWTDGEIPPGKDDHPVILVSLIDAQAYCNWLSGKTGCTYRLPSEQEWEKAARGPFPDDRRYPWGNGWYKDYCNTNETDSGNTTPVTAFESINKSSFGVVDMAGNVWEWTSSVYIRYGTTVSSSDSFAGLKYTVRGGACTLGPNNVRISCRGRYSPHDCKSYLGFRVALNILDKKG